MQKAVHHSSSPEQQWLPLSGPVNLSAARPEQIDHRPLAEQLREFREFGEVAREMTTCYGVSDSQSESVPIFVNEFWTARQRQASRLHEISYRACFKPQLPRFFIERLTQHGDAVYDPFMGRGTTLVEAALMGRIPLGNDINPLSATLVRPRLHPPELNEIATRLNLLNLSAATPVPDELLVFYHPETLKEICALKEYLMTREAKSELDAVDHWIRMVALNRLTGHSAGFFSVYTLPPNQATSVVAQRKINEKRGQTPPRRDVRRIILKKSKILLSDCDAGMRHTIASVASKGKLLTCPASSTPQIDSNSVQLVITSPPFLDVVQYAADNWLRCWFLGIDAKAVQISTPKKLDEWRSVMTDVFHELHRMLKPGGHVAFEVGEVHGGKTKLEEHVLPCGIAAGLKPELVLINDQEFTKTANCWGVNNNAKGTNTNRIVVFQKT